MNYAKKEIDAGNGNVKILISDDDEGNGYHKLFYGFTNFNKEFYKVCSHQFYGEKPRFADYKILG